MTRHGDSDPRISVTPAFTSHSPHLRPYISIVLTLRSPPQFCVLASEPSTPIYPYISLPRAMADVVPSQTAEINDAVFCLAHFKEVVRPTKPFPLTHRSLQLILILILFPYVFAYVRVHYSAPSAKLTCGRRTTGSSGYVSGSLIYGRSRARMRASAPWWNHSRTGSPLLQFDFIDREALEAPPTGQNKDNVYQCKKHSSAGTALRSSHPISFFLILSARSNNVTHVLIPFQIVANVMAGRNRSCVRGLQLRKLIGSSLGLYFVAPEFRVTT